MDIAEQRLPFVKRDELDFGFDDKGARYGSRAVLEDEEFRALNIDLDQVGGGTVFDIVEPSGFHRNFLHDREVAARCGSADPREGIDDGRIRLQLEDSLQARLGAVQ